MLSPKVWNFSAPKPVISYKTYDFIEDVIEVVNKQPFNHHVSITLPNTLKAPEDFTSALLEDSQYYKIDKVPISEIFDINFINLFLKNGVLTSLSIKTLSDSDFCFALIPSGKLILNVNEKTFQELGLESIKKYVDNCGKIIILDVIHGCENLKKYESIKQKLLHKSLIFDIILAWEPYDSFVCPSSIASYFFKKGYFVKTCDIKFHQRISYNVNVPIYDNSDKENLIEWLGAFNLQCNLFDDNYISTFNFTDDNELVGQVHYTSFTGLLTNSRIKKLILAISDFIKATDFQSWIALVINGFKGSFISGKNENYFQSIGDHHHTIIFKNNHPKLIQFFQIS